MELQQDLFLLIWVLWPGAVWSVIFWCAHQHVTDGDIVGPFFSQFLSHSYFPFFLWGSWERELPDWSLKWKCPFAKAVDNIQLLVVFIKMFTCSMSPDSSCFTSPPQSRLPLSLHDLWINYYECYVICFHISVNWQLKQYKIKSSRMKYKL